jgi:hypothetical protein
MNKGDFDFQKDTVYKIEFERFYRPGDKGVIIASFQEETKWHMEFGHAYDVDKKHTSMGRIGLMWEDIKSISEPSDEEFYAWKKNCALFMASILARESDPCFEDITKSKKYKKI